MLFSTLWKIVAKFIDPVTRKKFNVIGTNQKKVRMCFVCPYIYIYINYIDI
jgi:hypothetical protein